MSLIKARMAHAAVSAASSVSSPKSSVNTFHASEPGLPRPHIRRCNPGELCVAEGG
jgi:hypothetical protein